MAAVRGSVAAQVAGIELLARYSLSSLRHASVRSDLEDFKEQERESVTDKEWNWKILRDQFQRKDLEELFRKYDDKLRLSYLSTFLIFQFLIFLTHNLVLFVETNLTDINGIIAVSCYTLQTILPIPILVGVYFEKIQKKFKRYNLIASIFVLTILFTSDVLVPILNQSDTALRVAYSTQSLLVCYIFLPILNNYIALALGILMSVGYLGVLAIVTYEKESFVYRKLCSDILYLAGVNMIGIYYRLMNEIVSRRSFLDRRACVESTYKLNFEKNQEEKLMLSILPEHIASVVRQDIRKIFLKIQSDDRGISTQTFNHLYIKEHKNVTILYADIVNYTMLTTTLKPRLLVETLNDLFGKFDKASQEHNVLRIKFLGDCYYCVSGVPEPNPRHAKSCVDLGLEMISIIGDVRKGLDIDMRIGVHTGDIMSGIIGIKKWQFDIWSKDVTIANKMESTGRPGKVHITKRTLEELRDCASTYIIEPNFEARNDPFIAKYKIETFLVTNMPRRSSMRFRRVSVVKKISEPPRLSGGPGRRTTTFMGTNLIAYNQMLKASDAHMREVIDEMPSGIISEYINEESINPWTMLYRNNSWEKTYIKKPDPLFKYFILVSLFILILMVGIQALTIEALGWKTLVIEAAFTVVLLLLQPLNWTQYFYTKFQGSEEPSNKVVRFLHNQSVKLVWSSSARTLLYIFISCMLAISALINLTECNINVQGDSNSGNITQINCIEPWHLAQAVSLVLLLSSLFSRVLFIFKWLMSIALMIVYIILVWHVKSKVFEYGHSWNYGLDARIAHTMAMVFLTFTLHLTDRQTEYRNRLDHKWKRQVTEEQEEAYTMKMVNNMLLQNILPAHVADIYLNHRLSSDELYYEEYTSVAVMFASLTDYKLGIEDDDDVPERTMLKILDQLISDFDKLLLCENTQRMKVEKIKMAGWTYMAACGLDPGRRESQASGTSGPRPRHNQSYEDDIILTMLQFAAAMMIELRAFNKNSFQGTNLKIGISHGEVTAGVVGSLKPLYDIWGDAVNMASRMDSTGEAGKIQVTENTAIALGRQGVLTQFRGVTFVKGVGFARTYYVPLDKDFNIIKTEAQPIAVDLIEDEENDSVTVTRC